ncbi:MAG TPA: hypothetical protein P5531_03825 [Bacteroidales bacterium]|nr:hypothetical protein [Bacteroidales bacterium]
MKTEIQEVTKQHLTIDYVARMVCMMYQIDTWGHGRQVNVSLLRSRLRNKEYRYPRNMFVKLCFDLKLDREETARWLDNRDRTTLLNNYKRATSDIIVYSNDRRIYEAIMSDINNALNEGKLIRS